MTEKNKKTFLDKLTEASMKFGAQVHLRSLRDAFTIMLPLFIIAGIAVLINSVILPKILSEAQMEIAQYWAISISNATLNLSGLLICGIVAYTLSVNKGFEHSITAIMVSISSLIVMMPQIIDVTGVNSEEIKASGILSFNNLGTTAMFAGIIIGLVATELFIKLSNIKAIKIKIGGDVPPAVNNSFNNLIPVILTLIIFSLVSFGLFYFFDVDLITLIATMIQEPLRAINTSLLGTIIIYSAGNLVFTLGIHQAVIYSTILEPLLLVNINENMAAARSGAEIPHIMNLSLVQCFGLIGGSGSTLCLLIAVFIFFRKNEQYKQIAELSILPSIFNINEPIIFGFPIVFNLPMMIPFVAVPALGLFIGYIATALGFMNPATVLVPWTTPALLNAYLATGADFRAILVQLVVIVLGVLIYLPFLKIYARTLEKQSQLEKLEN